MPGRAERAGRDVVGLLGEDVEVGHLRLVHELQVGQRRGALRDDPGVEVLPTGRDGCGRTRPGTRPSRSGQQRGSRRTPGGCRRRAPRAGCRRRSARRARRRSAAPGTRPRCPATTTSGRVPAEDVAQLRLAVAGPVHQRLPGGPDERLELGQGGLAELRRGVPDEVLPERAGVLLVGPSGPSAAAGPGRPGPPRSPAAPAGRARTPRPRTPPGGRGGAARRPGRCTGWSARTPTRA